MTVALTIDIGVAVAGIHNVVDAAALESIHAELKIDLLLAIPTDDGFQRPQVVYLRDESPDVENEILATLEGAITVGAIGFYVRIRAGRVRQAERSIHLNEGVEVGERDSGFIQEELLSN